MTSYFEFYGLPGAGKTTLIDPLIQKLESEGYKVAGRSVVHNRLYYRYTKLFVIVEMLLHVTNYKIYYKYWKLQKKSDFPDVKYYKKLVLLVHQILMIVQANKYDFVIFDEGIIQHTSSLFYQDDFKGHDIMQEIVKDLQNKIKIHPIFCSISLEESLKRMKERPYGQDRRYSYSRGLPLLEKIMRIRIHNMDEISSFFPTPIVVDMNNNINDNIKILKSNIIANKA